MRKNHLFLLVACLMTISTLIGGCSGIQNKAVNSANKYPEKPITIIVPFSVGGGQDLAARTIEKDASKYLGQSLIIVNKPGGAGINGWNELAASRPDGYTIGMTGAELITLPIYGTTKYNYISALQPLAQITSSSWIVVIQSKQPWKSIGELVTYAKEHPGELKFSHGGIGSFPHLIGEMINKESGIDLEQVPFQSSGEALTALLGGHVQVAIVNPSVVKAHIDNGTIRALAVTGKYRLDDPCLADIPTLMEQDFNIEFENWFGLAAPKDIPPEAKAKLAEGLKKMTEDEEFKQHVKNMGLQVEYLDPQKVEMKWINEKQELSKIIHEDGILDLIRAQKK
ncbi:MAG: tripartite tricarboxylate transporter substrate binding protein [Veillonellales bacterium]